MNPARKQLQDEHAEDRFFDSQDMSMITIDVEPVVLLALLFFAGRHGTCSVMASVRMFANHPIVQRAIMERTGQR